MSEKTVDDRTYYTAKVFVEYHKRKVVNPNGRGFSQDNIIRVDDFKLTEVTLRADSIEKLTAKVAAIMSTVDEVVE